MADDDDEGGFGGLYEDGHWVWDDNTANLMFMSDIPPVRVEAVQIATKAPTGTIEFRDDVDLIEQIRFRRRYQRKLKPGQADIITVQDVKDIALYTAPVNLLSPMLINMLHLPTTERFIRALTLWCAYYLQIADEMSSRIMELETKIRTPVCDILEKEFRDNLSDLRVLVAKEYSTMLIGGGDTRKFHHMGPQKKRRSLSDKDARLFETLLRMCVQIVWLALGRKSFNQIELEVNRIFKSEIFNAVEHTLQTGYVAKMAKEERSVLLGHCVRHDKKLNTRSPLMNEVFCHRPIDYRIMGLGVIKCSPVTTRLQYLLQLIVGPEDNLNDFGLTLGIIGMPRSAFDTMLRPLPTSEMGKKSKASMYYFLSVKYLVVMQTMIGYYLVICCMILTNIAISPWQFMTSTSAYSSKSTGSRKSTMTVHKLYPDIVIPSQETQLLQLPSSFPDIPEAIRQCSETQRRRWQTRFQKLLHPQSISH